MIPEGLVDSIPELRLLISEIDGVFAECGNTHLENSDLTSKLTMWSKALLDSLPDFMQSALLLSRGSDTHFQVITSLVFYHLICTFFYRLVFKCHIALHGIKACPLINLTINLSVLHPVHGSLFYPKCAIFEPSVFLSVSLSSITATYTTISPSSLCHLFCLQVSQAETERLLAHFVDIELGYRKQKGTYKG